MFVYREFSSLEGNTLKNKFKNPDAITQNVLGVLRQEKITTQELSLRSQVPVARLNEYFSGERKLGTKVIGKIAKALNRDVSEFFGFNQLKTGQHSKSDLLGIFVEAINEFQRKSTSMSELRPSEYKNLFNCVEILGGWRRVLLILEKEIFEAPRRERKFQEEFASIMDEVKYDYSKRKQSKRLQRT